MDPLFFVKEKKMLMDGNEDILVVKENEYKDWSEKKIRYLDASKLYFGCVLQLVYQFWILRISVYHHDERLSQYLSVFSSTFFIREDFKTNYLFHK